MTKPAPITDPSERRQAALVEAATSMIRQRLDTHFAKIEQAAADTTNDSEEPIKAKVAFGITWPAGASKPNVKVKIRYGTITTEEADVDVDPDQMSLGLETEK